MLTATPPGTRPISARQAVREWMPRLVDADLARPRDLDHDDPAPALVLDPRAELGALGRQLRDRGLDVVAHQAELVPGRPGIGRVDRHLARRQPEDQPAAAGVDVREAEDVPEERPRRLRVL